MDIIHHVQSYFKNPTVKICLDARIRTIVILTGGNLTGIYFLQFTFCNDTPTPR
jgi:hypothetical protein